MKIEKNKGTAIDMRLNSFGQFVKYYDDYEYVTVTGSLDEIMDYSKTNSVYLERSKETEHLFQAWDTESKYVVVSRGEASWYVTKPRQIDGCGWYVHRAIVG